MTRIKNCDCKHEYQDEKYGKGKRVHNAKAEKNIKGNWQCTACGKYKQ